MTAIASETHDAHMVRSNVARLAVAQALTGANTAVIFATGSIVVHSDAAAAGSRGGQTDVAALQGEQKFVNDVDAGGQDITIRSDQVSIAADQVTRILSLVPYLLAHDGVSLTEAARAFSVTPRQLKTDLLVIWMVGAT